MPVSVNQIQNAYVAFFNRPADTAGLNYWSSYPGSATDLLNTFAVSSEYTSLYSGMNNTQIVNTVYGNLFGRESDLAGLNYWVGQLTSGNLKIGNIADAINKGAQGVDATAIANKTTAATSFTNSLDTVAKVIAYSSVSSSGLAAVKTWLSGVTTTASLTTSTSAASLTAITSTVSSNVSATGQTFTLTNSSNQTTGGADNFNGSAGNDTFLALADGSLDNGDVVNGGSGTDTLTARYSLNGNKTINTSIVNVETVLVDLDDGLITTAETFSMSVDSFTGLSTIGVKDSASTSTKEDTVAFSNIATGVQMAVINGDANSKVTFGYKTTTGLTDAAKLSMEAGVADTITVAGIETINIVAVSGKSAVDTLTTTAATTLNISGAGELTLTNVDDVTKTIDASTMTGKLSVDGIGAIDVAITGGSGDDTIAMGTSLTTADTLVGGSGVDTLEVGADLTAVQAKVTGFETISLKITDIDVANGGAGDAAGTAAVSGAAITTVTKFSISVNTATDNDDGTVTISDVDNGDTVSVVSAGGDSTTLADGIALTITQTTDTLADNYTLSLEGIGAVTADVTANTGISKVTIDSVETLNLVSNANSSGSVTTNNAEELQAQAATGIIVTGSADLDLDSIVNTTKLVSINASAATGKLTIDGIDASKLVFRAAQKDTVISLAGLNNEDQLIGGAGTKDSAVATSVTGLTATTGKLNIQNFETVELQATGANTIDTSLLSGVTTLAISGATPGTQTITGLAGSGVAVSAGSATATFANGDTLDISLADATGAADALSLVVNNTAAATASAAIKTANIETINISVAATSGNDAAVSMTNSTAANIAVTGGGAGAVLALGTLNAAVRSVNLSAYAGEVTFTGANATAGMTVVASSSHADDNFTTSAFADTITVAETGAVDVDVDGGAGTDTLNLTVKAGFVDTKEIDNIENINITVRAGDSITIGAGANESNGIDEAKELKLAGGNELSVFKIAGDNLAGTTLLSVDASAFAGKADLTYAADALLSTMVIKGGALTTDTLRGLYDTSALSRTLQTTGIDVLRLTLNSGATAADETYTFDLSKMTGLKTISASATTQNTTLNITEYNSATTIQLGDNIDDDTAAPTRDAGEDFGNSSTLAVTLASASGTADALNIDLLDTDDAAGTIVVTAAGVEALNLKTLGSGETHKLNLSGVAATTDSKLAITLTGTGTDAVTITNVASTANVINASGMAGALTISDRGSSAMTITGGTGADSLRMEAAADVMTGGTGTDTLVIVQNAVLGGFQIDLTSATDQVGTYNGSANAAVQIGFESVDASGITGTFGVDITAIKTGSKITGTTNSDVITLGAAVDTVVTIDATIDTINSFTKGAAGDVFNLSIAALEAAGGINAAASNFTKLNSAADGADVAAGASTIQELTLDGAAGAVNAGNRDIFVMIGATVASTDAVETALEAGGDVELTIHAADDVVGSSFFVVYSDGTDAYLASVRVNAATAADTNFEATNLTAVNIAKLVGVTSIATTDFNVANFTWI